MDPTAKTMMFLKYHVEYPINEMGDCCLLLPLTSADENLIQEIVNKKGKSGEVISKIERKKKELDDNFKEYFFDVSREIFRPLIEDKLFQQYIKTGRIPKEVKDKENIYFKAMERNRASIESALDKMVPFFGEFKDFLEDQYPILSSVQMLPVAMTNNKILNAAGITDIGTLKETLERMLNVVPHLHVSTAALCLTCPLSYALIEPPCSFSEKFSKHPSFPTRCPKCDQNAMYVTLSFECEPSFAHMFEENRFPEFVVGHAIEETGIFKSVYIHKKIHSVENGSPKQGVEIDVLGITNDGRVIIIEVTTKTDLNNIMNELNQKEETFKILDYDTLIYVTACPDLKRYISQGKSFVTGARHIPQLQDHLREILK
jgi:hypothetical protein